MKGENMETIVEQVKTIDPSKIELPILRRLVDEVQAKSQDQIYEDNRMWTDSNWSQWKQHSSHNPW
jgi:threonine dehydratase